MANLILNVLTLVGINFYLHHVTADYRDYLKDLLKDQFSDKICNDDNCIILFNISSTWNDAKESCEEVNGHLLSVTGNEIEQHAVEWMALGSWDIVEAWIGSHLEFDDEYQGPPPAQGGPGGSGGSSGDRGDRGQGGQDHKSRDRRRSKRDEPPHADCKTFVKYGSDDVEWKSCFDPHPYICFMRKNEAWKCQSNYISCDNNTETCIRVANSELSWFHARQACIQDGAILLDINSHDVNYDCLDQSEQQPLDGGGGRLKPIWVDESEVHWLWTDETEVHYTNWFLSGAPSRNVLDEKCVSLGVSGEGSSGWYSKKCNDELPFFCQFNREDLPWPARHTKSDTNNGRTRTPPRTWTSTKRPRPTSSEPPDKDNDIFNLALYIGIPVAALILVIICVVCVITLRKCQQKAIDKAVAKRLNSGSLYSDINVYSAGSQLPNGYALNLPENHSIMGGNSHIHLPHPPPYQSLDRNQSDGASGHYDFLQDHYDTLVTPGTSRHSSMRSSARGRNQRSRMPLPPTENNEPSTQDPVHYDYVDPDYEEEHNYLQLLGADNTSNTSRTALMPGTPTETSTGTGYHYPAPSDSRQGINNEGLSSTDPQPGPSTTEGRSAKNAKEESNLTIKKTASLRGAKLPKQSQKKPGAKNVEKGDANVAVELHENHVYNP